MVKQGWRRKRYVIIEEYVSFALKSDSQSLAKRKHPQRKRRTKNPSSSSDQNSFRSVSASQKLHRFSCVNRRVGRYALQSRSEMPRLRIQKRLSGRRNKRLRSGGNKATTWSRTRSSVSFWKVRPTRFFRSCLLLSAPTLNYRGEGS